MIGTSRSRPHAQVQSIHLPDGLISAVRSLQREMRLEQNTRLRPGAGPSWYFILCPFMSERVKSYSMSTKRFWLNALLYCRWELIWNTVQHFLCLIEVHWREVNILYCWCAWTVFVISTTLHIDMLVWWKGISLALGIGLILLEAVSVRVIT